MTKQQPNSRNRRTEKAPPHAQPERRRSGGGAAVREPACEPCNPSNKDRRSRQEQETTLTPAQEAEEERILLENEKTAQKLYIKSMADHVAAMINLLVTRKQLPSFYFHDAARAAGIPQKTFRNWKIREWPETPMRKHSRIQDIGQTLLLVMLRMSKYPHSETYWEAVARLQKRIRTLLATYSRNSLTQLMNVPNGTIDKILVMENKERGRYNHCPWALLEKLNGAEDKIHEQAEMEMAYQFVRADRQERPAVQGEPPEPVRPPEEQLEAYIIPIQGNCHKCRNPWQHLEYEGPIRNSSLHSYSCRTCGSTNVVRTPIIERHSRCGSCGLSWWNMKIRTKEPDGSSVIICPRCGMKNLIPPKGAPAEGYRRMHGIMESTLIEGDGQDSDEYEQSLTGREQPATNRARP